LQLGGGARARARLDGDDHLPAAALGGLGAVVLVREEVLHRAQQERAEPPPSLLHVMESAPGKEPCEEALGEVARGLVLAAALANERQHRRIVGLAQFAQRRLRPRRFPPGTQHERPAGFHEPHWTRCRIF
jgi:hypothetical protein